MRLNGCQTSLGGLILKLNKRGFDLEGEHIMTYKSRANDKSKPSHLSQGEVDISYTTKSQIKIGQKTKPSVFFLPVNGVMNSVTEAMTKPYLEEIGSPSRHNTIKGFSIS